MRWGQDGQPCPPRHMVTQNIGEPHPINHRRRTCVEPSPLSRACRRTRFARLPPSQYSSWEQTTSSPCRCTRRHYNPPTRHVLAGWAGPIVDPETSKEIVKHRPSPKTARHDSRGPFIGRNARLTWQDLYRRLAAHIEAKRFFYATATCCSLQAAGQACLLRPGTPLKIAPFPPVSTRSHRKMLGPRHPCPPVQRVYQY